MIYDFSFEQVMRLSSIRRWGIIEMSRDQSVAEHSYNVAMIAFAIASHDSFGEVMGGDHGEFLGSVMKWALVHDLPEVVSGDIPTPVKKYLGSALDDMEEDMFPLFSEYGGRVSYLAHAIVKVADFIDAIQFARKFCVDSRKDRIIADMIAKMDKHMDAIAKNGDVPITEAVEKVWPDAKTRSSEA